MNKNHAHRNATSLSVLCLLLAAGCGTGTGAGGEAQNDAPTVAVSAPAQDVEIGLSSGGIVAVTYTDNDTDDVAVTDLVADQDGDPTTTADQVLIAADRPEMDGTPQTVDWTVDGVAPGNYRILALTRDAAHAAVGEAPGQVALNGPSTLSIDEPSGDQTVSRGGSVTITYTDDDPDDVALTWITADRDGDPASREPSDVTTAPRPEMDGAMQAVRIGLGHAAEGERFSILGTTWDGTNVPATAAASGTVEIRNIAWARRAGGASEVAARAVAALADGSCRVTGYFLGSATFGAGEAGETTLTAGGTGDVFVARFAAEGTLVWVRQVGLSGFNFGFAIAAFPDGSSVVTGSFSGSATFGAGEAEETTLTAAGSNDAFVARYGADGTLGWARQAAGTAFAAGQGIATMPDGSCRVTGQFTAGSTFGAGEAGETTLTSAGESDIFVARYGADGALTWARSAGGPDGEEGADVAVWPDGSCAVTGVFRSLLGSATFGAGEANETTLTAAGSTDVFVARYEADGTLAFAKRAGGTDDDAAHGVVAFADGSCVVAGNHIGTSTFGPGEAGETVLTAVGLHDGFVARYRAGGTLDWVRQIEGTSQQVCYAIEALPGGAVLIAGRIAGTTTFGPGEPNETILDASTSSDAFVARYAPHGALDWARNAPGTAVNMNQAYGVAAFPDGSSVATGTFGASATFGPGEAMETTLTSAGSTDMFVARYNADGGF
jgi:hypothetical protein